MTVPLISICLPNLNTLRFLPERMETILSQSLQDWELIICDSYSDDGSWEFFQKFKGDPRIKMHQVPREGIYAGWNECLKRTRGKYIYIATSDDTATPTLLATLIKPLEKRSDLHLSICDYQLIDETGAVLPYWDFEKRAFMGEWMSTQSIRNGLTEFILHACFGFIWVTITCVLFRKDLLSMTGLFHSNYGTGGDNNWALRASLFSDIAYHPGKLATWRVHPSCASSKAANASLADLYHNGAISLRTVLREEDLNIPPEWKKVSDWQRRVSYMRDYDYCRWLSINREDLVDRPFEIVNKLWSLFLFDRYWFIKKARYLFRHKPELYADRIAIAKSLISDLRVSWPPVPCTELWD